MSVFFWCQPASLDPSLHSGAAQSPLYSALLRPGKSGAQWAKWAPLPNPVSGAQALRQPWELTNADAFPLWEAALEFMCIFVRTGIKTNAL